MSKIRTAHYVAVATLVVSASHGAWAFTALPPGANLPGPGVLGLVAAGIVAAIAASRSSK